MVNNENLCLCDSSYLGDMDTIVSPQAKCLKVQCRIICFNGRQSEIAKDITIALTPVDEVSILQ